MFLFLKSSLLFFEQKIVQPLYLCIENYIEDDENANYQSLNVMIA